MNAIKLTKPKKAIGSDEIHSTITQLFDKSNIGNLIKLFNEIYREQEKFQTNG